MKALKAKTLYYILIMGFIALLAAGAAGFYWAQTSLTAKKAEVIKKETELVDAQKRTDQLLQLSRRFGEANTRLIDINQALPRSSQQGEILLDIKEAARQSGVDLPSIQFTGTAS
ncbi:type 4a pilus biogenesis protein PilO, partial [Candidatus Saccharibacteria bacterium]|nr:type 4a pilus biogenesis protein PilO [Candidatus Saccharibacteria bacterium]